MNNKILIIANKKSNMLDAITYKFAKEKVEWTILNEKTTKHKYNIIVVIGKENMSYVNDYLFDDNSKIIVVSDRKVNKILTPINSIITSLLNDDTKYSITQKEYLFRRDLYGIIIDKIYEIIINIDNFITGIAIDYSDCETNHKDWTFEFDSIRETYEWLTKTNNHQNKNIEQKTIDFYLDRIYNDSDKEIKYLIEKIESIKSGKISSDIYVCSKEELKSFRKNKFFRLLVHNLSTNYKIYIVDKDEFITKCNDIYNKVLYGIIVYQDCVYKDYLNNEYSLGYVNCNKEVIDEYSKYYDLIIKKLGKEIKSERDLDEL